MKKNNFNARDGIGLILLAAGILISRISENESFINSLKSLFALTVSETNLADIIHAVGFLMILASAYFNIRLMLRKRKTRFS